MGPFSQAAELVPKAALRRSGLFRADSRRVTRLAPFRRLLPAVHLCRIPTQRLHQPLTRRILLLIDDRAIPGQFVGTPPDQGDQSYVDQTAEWGEWSLKLNESQHRDDDDDTQREREHRRITAPLLNRDPCNANSRHHEQGENETEPSAVPALIKYLDQKKN